MRYVFELMCSATAVAVVAAALVVAAQSSAHTWAVGLAALLALVGVGAWIALYRDYAKTTHDR